MVVQINDFDIFIEIDGPFHPDKIENISLIAINTVLNDIYKNSLMKNKNFYRIRWKNNMNFTQALFLEQLKKNSYIPDYSLSYRQVVMKREYFEKYIKLKGKNKLAKYVTMLLKFIRTFQNKFPTVETNEKLKEIIDKINKYDLDRVYDNKIFNNNCYTIGVSYLKSIFRSYWKSSYSGALCPVDAWNDDKIMKKVIEYRIGLNNSNEVFDFSLHQLIRGLSAKRFTISFFKPLLAAAIYKHFLGDIENPTVIDPCAGFGGRLLGFKSVYPNGTYIGIEPNIETFQELKQLSKNFDNVKLYNCTLEEFDGDKNCDLTFTSIPYYNKETYSTNIEYNSFKDWDERFISSLLTYKNLIVNIHKDFEKLFNYSDKYFIKNNTSHFNKKSNEKFELLLKI